MLESFSYAERMAERGTPSGPAAFPSIAKDWTDPDGDGRVESCECSDGLDLEEAFRGTASNAQTCAHQIYSHVWNCYTGQQSPSPY